MNLFSKLSIAAAIAILTCFLFYKGYLNINVLEEFVDNKNKQQEGEYRHYNEEEWQRFLQLEELIATYITEKKLTLNNYENFATELDRIFDETFKNYDEAPWNKMLNTFQSGFPARDTRSIMSILKCYRLYKSQIDHTREFSLPVNKYRYLFRKRINYFGLAPTQHLFAAEYAFLAPQLDFLSSPNYRAPKALCQIIGLD